MKQFRFTETDVATWPKGHKACVVCREIKPFSAYHKHARARFGYNTVCKECRLPITLAHYHSVKLETIMHYRAKARAKRKGVSFDIDVSDVVIPEFCPVLGIKLVRSGEDLHDSPSLDRIKPELGYVKGNVRVISYRANMLKNNATVEELQKVLVDLVASATV